MPTWLVAILGGAVGSVVTASIAWSGRFFRAHGEVEAHDRFVAERDEDLASWVSDRSLSLWRELNAMTEEMNKKNLFYSGAHGLAISLLKVRAPQQYRDQERRVRRDVALVEQAEGTRHRFWRKWRNDPFPQLTTPARGERVIDEWRAPVRRHGKTPIKVVDITKRGLDEALFEIEGGGGFS
jgi:hypothetical protein